MKNNIPKIDFNTGEMTGVNIEKYTKKYSEISHIYSSIDKNITQDTKMYDVAWIDAGEDKTLLWGVTTLYPVLVNNECNMTRGHFHVDMTEPEIYIGISGSGILMKMDENQNCIFEDITPGSIHYISGKYAHRVINTSTKRLSFAAAWSNKAGHDYNKTEIKPFPYRIFRNGDDVVKVKD